MASKTRGLTNKEMHQIRVTGRRKAQEAMKKQQERESGPRCWICNAPLVFFPAICTACGTKQKSIAGGTEK